MKTFALLSLLVNLTVSPAFAATTVEFNLKATTFVDNKEVEVDITKLNQTLKAKGLEGLPEKVVVSTAARPYWNVLMRRIEAANKVVPTEMLFSINSGYYYEYPPMCYSGKAAEVVAVLDAMYGSFLNNEQGVMAFRFGKTKVVRATEFRTLRALKERYGDDASDEVKAWLEYDQKSKDVLVMSDLGPQGDGTELYATFIKPCK